MTKSVLPILQRPGTSGKENSPHKAPQLPFPTHHKAIVKAWQKAELHVAPLCPSAGSCCLYAVPAGEKGLLWGHVSPGRITAGLGLLAADIARSLHAAALLHPHTQSAAGAGPGEPPHSNKTSKSIRKCSHPTPGETQNLE